MKRKIISSLIIAAYCFNSLPAFAAPLPGPMEEVLNNLSRGVAAYGTPKEKKRFKRGLELRMQSEPGQNSEIVFSIVTPVSNEISPTPSGKSIVRTHFLVIDGKTKESTNLNRYEKVLYAMYEPSKNPDDTCFIGNVDGRKSWCNTTRSIDQMLSDLKLQMDDLVSRSARPADAISLKGGSENLTYAYLRFIPSKFGCPGEPDQFSPRTGCLGLSFQEFQRETAGLSENFLAASYSPSQGTLIALLTKDGCFPLKELKKNNPSCIVEVMDELLEAASIKGNLTAILKEKAASFSARMNCCFGDLSNIFTRSHIGTGVNSSLRSSLPVEQEKPTAPCVIGDGAAGGIFSTQGYDYGLSDYTNGNDSLLLTQSPYVMPDNNLGYYIGVGALAVGAGILTIGGIIGGVEAIYHWWKAKKPERNEAYDEVIYARDECEKPDSDDESQVAISITRA